MANLEAIGRVVIAAATTSFEKISSSFKSVLVAIKNLAGRFFNYLANFFSRRAEKPANNPIVSPPVFVKLQHSEVGFNNYPPLLTDRPLADSNVTVEDAEGEKQLQEALKHLENAAIKKVVGEIEFNRVQEEIERLELEGNGVIACYNITLEQQNQLLNDLPKIALELIAERKKTYANTPEYVEHLEKQKKALLQKFPHLANQ